MKNRISAFQTALKSAFLVTDPHDQFYLTGVELDGYWLLVSPKKTIVFTSEMLAGQLKTLLKGVSVVSGANIFDLLINYCKKNGLGKIGINAQKTTLSLARKLEKHIGIELLNDPVEPLRMVKDKKEIEIIRRSCKIAVQALEAVRPYIRPGVSEEDISFKIEEYFAKKHCRPSFLPIVASGPNTAKPHHISGPRKIAKNDVVMIDLGCVYKGYCSDLTRTFLLGKINHLKKNVFSLVNRAQKQALEKAGPGVSSAAVDNAARALIAHEGHGACFTHSTGHGVGAEIHESPRVSSKDMTVMKPGMVITIEPGVYLCGKFGVRIEDTVLITNKSCEVLTR